MASKARCLVGLDVHASQTHAAVLDLDSGELGVSKLRMPPVEVVGQLEQLGPGVVAVYEAGPTGFGLAREARRRGIEVRVVAPGSIPRAPGDPTSTGSYGRQNIRQTLQHTGDSTGGRQQTANTPRTAVKIATAW